jgi:CheY-like chemotaxis protein/MinD-like ATPase involved in chromosome partitioning or flagellar assembly
MVLTEEKPMPEKILIVDDDVDTLKLVGMMLQKQGYQIVAASNGPQGLSQAEAENPSLILLDVMMPDMDGYEVAKRLRASPVTANTPILMFTAKTQLDDKVSGFEAGADDYLTKPTHPTELIAHVKALLARTNKVPAAPAVSAFTETKAYTIGVLAGRGGLGVSTLAVNLGDALQNISKAEVIVAELRPGMGTLGPELGKAEPTALTELLSGPIPEITRQKVKEKLYTTATGLHILLGSVQPKDAALVNSLPAMEALVNRMSQLAPHLILDLGAGLTPLAQKLAPLCQLILVVVEPVPSTIALTKALIADLVEMGLNNSRLQAVVVNRIRTDTQLNMTQVEEGLGRLPIVAITPAPELLYMASRTKTTAVNVRPDSLTTQQFAKLAASVLDL